jgi:hypothetical protein
MDAQNTDVRVLIDDLLDAAEEVKAEQARVAKEAATVANKEIEEELLCRLGEESDVKNLHTFVLNFFVFSHQRINYLIF